MPIEGVEAYLRAHDARGTTMDARDIDAGIAATKASGEIGVIDAEFDAGNASRFGVRICEGGSVFTAIGYDHEKKQLFIDRRYSGRVDFHPDFSGNHAASMSPGPDGLIKLTIALDRDSVEVFGNGGVVAMTSLIFPPPDAGGVSLFSEGGTCKLIRFDSFLLDGH